MHEREKKSKKPGENEDAEQSWIKAQIVEITCDIPSGLLNKYQSGDDDLSLRQSFGSWHLVSDLKEIL